jgi:anti-sigma factor ChrR (cupin superfamily)
MADKAEVNADANATICIHTHDVPWQATEHAGISEKVLERINDPEKGRVTALLKFEPGASLPTETLTTRTEIMVLDGRLSDGIETYGRRTFVRNPAGTEVTLSSDEGCEIYIKRRIPFRDDDERFVVDTETCEWTSFPHRGADVVHFYRDRHGIDTSRFGEVRAEVKIPSHDHAMGEETLIVDGCLKDEYDTYGPGTWFRFPVGVPHAPYTEEQTCVMLIREGDLVW